MTIEIPLPTVKELNNLDATRVQLLILRCLNTSDLTFHFTLMAARTVRNIVDLSISLRHTSINIGEYDLTTEETGEYLDYIENMKDYGESDFGQP